MSVPTSPPILSAEARSYLFRHVFLPPKLPQQDDYDAGHEITLLDSVIHALNEFKAHATETQHDILAFAITAISRLSHIHGSYGDVSEKELGKALRYRDVNGGCLPIHIRSQNAAVLLTKMGDDDMIHVETFELSPRNESVNNTVGRLQRQFPGLMFALD